MICCSVTVCVGVCVCVVPGLYEGGRRGLVVECQDDPLTKGTIRDKLLLLWYLAYTVGRSVVRVSSHTHWKSIHTCLHTRWWMENHVLNTGNMVNMFIATNHQRFQRYHQKDICISPPSVIMSSYYLNHMGDGFSKICTHHIYTAMLSQPGRWWIFNTSAFAKWLSVRVREGMMLRQLYSEWITVMVAVVKGAQAMQWPIHVSLRVGCMYPIFTMSPLVLKTV